MSELAVSVMPANGRPLTEEELAAATRAANRAVEQVRMSRQRTCATCQADVEAVVVRGRGHAILVDAAPVIPATEMDGLMLRPDPASAVVDPVPAGAGQAIHSLHACDRSRVLDVVEAQVTVP